MTCTFSPMEYRAATKKRCLGRSSECARLVDRSRPARACYSNYRVMSFFSALLVVNRAGIVDASRPNFKAFSNVIKEEKEATTQTLQTLLPTRHSHL